jgi:hypothetical protein
MKNKKSMDGLPKASMMKAPAAKKMAAKAIAAKPGATAKVMAAAKKGGMTKKKGY